MDRAASCRRAARDAIADVEPPRLHDVLTDILDGTPMTPGVLTLASAGSLDATADLEGITHRAAGVQLVYEGLRLTRSLAHDEPWADSRTADPQSDLEILAADILVARGFYLLARTDAAGKAVRTVRSFGRDQTLREEDGADSAALDANLERDVLELAVATGAAAVGTSPTSELLGIAGDIAAEVGRSFPPASECLPDLEGRETRPGEPGDGVTTDRATSATDP